MTVKCPAAYRPEIDGLRAIAVLAVLFFHGKVPGFAGGFVGVDVFFVISGYLITRLIVEQHETGAFRLSEFYLRRLRRLFPAMVCTVLFTLLAGLFLLQPVQLIELAKSAVSATFSVSNLLFFVQTGYWDFAAHGKPLLHTWSLGVEEQFYLVWPWVVGAIALRPSRQALCVVLALATLSILGSAWVTPIHPAATFFLTPFRIYEFGFGAACVWLARYKWGMVLSGSGLGSATSLSGLLIILVCIARFDESMAFPGWLAALPCLGTALVILGNPAGPTGWTLSNPLSRYVGAISYSLYLVHWPVLVFATSGGLKPLTGHALIAAFAGTAVLAMLQYHAVERPFRYRGQSGNTPSQNVPSSFATSGRKTSATTSVVWFATATMITTCMALAIVVSDGFPQRYGARLSAIAAHNYNAERDKVLRGICSQRAEPGSTLCGTIDTRRRNILVVGDSKGPDGLNSLVSGYPEHNFLTAVAGGCPFRADLRLLDPPYTPNPACNALNELRFEALRPLLPKLDAVVLSQVITHEVAQTLPQTIGWLRQHGTRKILIFGNDPNYMKPVRELMVSHGNLEKVGDIVAQHENVDRKRLNLEARNQAAQQNVTWVDKREYICPNDRCMALTQDGLPFVYDWSHASYSGAREFGLYLKSTRPLLFASPKQ